MKKIISLYQRNYDGDRLVRDEVVPVAEWVLAGEGRATRKYDGTCCMVRDGKLYKRLDVRPGKTPPPDFEEEQHDETTGKRFGWVPVGDGPEDKWHRDAFDRGNVGYLSNPQSIDPTPPDGTYELLGPKVQGNSEGFNPADHHVLVMHGYESYVDRPLADSVPRDFEGLRRWLSEHDWEGIVWHHPDGRMVKIKAKDFGLKRPSASRG